MRVRVTDPDAFYFDEEGEWVGVVELEAGRLVEVVLDQEPGRLCWFWESQLTPISDYREARGAVPWKPGMPKPEDVI